MITLSRMSRSGRRALVHPVSHRRVLGASGIVRLGAIGVALGVAGCARDVIIKPAASSFATDTRTAMTAVSTRYDEVINDLNEQNVRFLADNPNCGLNTTVRLRTDQADALLKRLGGLQSSAKDQVGTDECLSSKEWETLLNYLAAHREIDLKAVAPERKLLILSRADFDLQMAAVKNLTDYVTILADASDAPDATASQDIDDLAKGLVAIGQSAGTLQQALTKGKDAGVGKLFANDGPVPKFASDLSDLAGAIEVIADQAHDVKRLQTAILGPSGQKVTALLGDLARDSDQWSCIRFQARLGAMDTDSQRLSSQLADMGRDQRLSVVRSYLQNESAVPDAQCGALASSTAVSPIAQMLEGLAKAHKDLERIARGQLTPAERRREAAATMQRLGAVFKAISSMALLVI